MLPCFVDEFEPVPIRIQHIGRVIVRVVVQACARRAAVDRTQIHGSGVGGIHFKLAVRDKTNMYRAPLDNPLTQPEEHPAVGAEAF